MRKLLFVPDTHSPYENKAAWALMLKVGRALKPHTVVHLGDMADFYAVSAHDKDPRRAFDLWGELQQTNRLLDDLDSLGARRKIFCEGNHENRMQRYLQTTAPALASLPCLSVPALLQLLERGWRYVRYREDAKVGRLHVTHDCGYAGRNALFQNGATYEGNVVTGHTHRMGSHYFGNAKGESHVAMSFGWLGDSAATDYMHRVKAAREWQLGFGVGYELPGGVVHLVGVPIVRGTCVVEGRRFAV